VNLFVGYLLCAKWEFPVLLKTREETDCWIKREKQNGENGGRNKKND
jgi:hypothetical protein